MARVSNLAGAIDRLKDEGLWIAGADMSGTAMTSARMEGALALVIGSEGDGIGRLVKEKCDFLVSIPMFGQIDSLNAAVHNRARPYTGLSSPPEANLPCPPRLGNTGG